MALVAIIFLFLCSVVYTQNILTFNLTEEQPSNTLVGDIASSSGLSLTLTNQEFRSLQYTLVDQNSDSGIFSLDKSTGRLTTTSVVDREIVCKSSVCVKEFGVAINSEQFTNIYHYFTVRVTIDDKNDNSPTFPVKQRTIQIAENTPVGYQKTIDSATDSDVGINGIQGYEIVPSNGSFGLNVTKKNDGSFSVKVQLRQPLDREIQKFYQFHVMAKDGGSPQNVGTLTVSVEIQDVNDNSPAFLQPFYEVSVNETIAVNSVILQCTAQDRDINENGRLTYRFSPQQEGIDLIQQMFSIDQEGKIRVISPLNVGVRKYKFFVEASDSGDEVRTTLVNVTVNVLDTGNNRPVVNLKYLRASEGHTVNVSEGSNLDLAIVHVTILDSDSGPNGQVVCSINDNSFGLQNVSTKMYVVILKKNLDRETKSRHNVTVTCTDKGTPPMSSSEQFIVNVMDENDKTPVFSKNIYYASIRENAGIGDIVTQVTASDDDVGLNAVVRYYIENGANGRFAINDNNGIISSSVRFDRETLAQVSFRVLAIDSGNPSLTGSATVIVNIADVNDNGPKFNMSHFQMYVMEGLEPNSEVGNITAHDADEGRNAQVIYGLANGTDHDLPFHLYRNGSLRTTAMLDREFKDQYTFTIFAYDQGLPMKSASAEVTVIVTDRNDNDPVVLFPNDTNDTVSISYLAPVGSYITTIKAYDRDSPINSQLQFKVLQGNEREIFELDPYSGELTMSNTFLIKEDTKFTLEISISDSGRPSRTETCRLRVVLLFTNLTSVQPISGEPNSKFVIISVVVVVFTVLVSGVILTIIFLLRRSDKRRAKELEKQEHRQQMYGELDQNFYHNDGMGYPNGDLRRKKKEVSFSLDDDLDKSIDKSLDMSNSSILADLAKSQVNLLKVRNYIYITEEKRT